MKYKLGMRVKSIDIITEGGDGEAPDFDAKTFVGNPGFVHAEPGDMGTVEYVDDDGCPTIRFDKTGTATIVGDYEIEVVQ